MERLATLNPLAAVLMGGLTGVGGGVVRDVLLNRVPVVLRADFYATAALAGALVTVVARRVGLGARAAALAGVATCFALRVAGARLHWSLPVVGGVNARAKVLRTGCTGDLALKGHQPSSPNRLAPT